MEQDTAHYSELIDLLNLVILEGLPHDRKKTIMLQMHAVKTHSRQQKLSDLTLNLLDIEDCLGFGQTDHTIDNERLEALIGQMESLANPDSETNDLNVEVKGKPSEQTETESTVAKLTIELTICNCSSRDEARDIARGLVETNLAACVNIIANIGSIYRWQGEIVDTSECQLHIKSSPKNRVRIADYIKQQHSNDVPEIITVPIADGNVDYLAWVLETTEVEIH